MLSGRGATPSGSSVAARERSPRVVQVSFLAETERQVEAHLAGHLKRLPPHDQKSRAIVTQMQIDEAGHATTAIAHGGVDMPIPVKLAMKLGSKVMTQTAYWV